MSDIEKVSTIRITKILGIISLLNNEDQFEELFAGYLFQTLRMWQGKCYYFTVIRYPAVGKIRKDPFGVFAWLQ